MLLHAGEMAEHAQTEPLVLDGYTFIRPLGEGGFGTVWLVLSAGTGSYHALKWISGSGLKHEWSAVKLFREVSQRLRSPHLIAIEHVNRTADALYYTLPLADGGPGGDPGEPAWHPVTLGDRIEQKRGEEPWFSSRELLEIFLPIARVVVELNKQGLVHRDIKPANILFFGGQPCLADIGLLGTDRASLSIRGTPGHIPPSWYKGEPDMWGLATTLYVLLTGNAPDTMGRANFRWPPGGEGSLSAGEKAEWLRLHAVILRATEENPAERFIGLEAFVRAVTGDAVIGDAARTFPPQMPLKESPKPAYSPNITRAVLLGILISIGIMFVWSAYDNGRVPPHASPQERVEEPLPEPAAGQSAPEVIPYPAHDMFKDWQAERQALGWDIEGASEAFKNNPLEWDNKDASKVFKGEL